MSTLRKLPPGAQEPPPYDAAPEVLEQICTVEPVRGSGPGGQRRNKVETGVRLSHPPSGVVIVATNRASRVANLNEAYERLAERLKDLNFVPKPRKKKRPPKASREKRLELKRHRAERKQDRRAAPKPHEASRE